MTVTSHPAAGNGASAPRVTIVCGASREYMWVSNGAAVTDWQLDQTVTFKNSDWRVVGRDAEQPDSLTLTLAPL